MSDATQLDQMQAQLDALNSAMQAMADDITRTREELEGERRDRRQDRRDTNEHFESLERDLGEVSRQHSKMCLSVSGEGVPKATKGEDTCAVLWSCLNRKFGLKLDSGDRAQVVSCHRGLGGGIIVSLNHALPGSVYVRMLFREKNWNGELTGLTGKQDRVVISKVPGPVDGPIIGALLFLRRKDIDAYPAAEDKHKRRIGRCDSARLSNVVNYRRYNSAGVLGRPVPVRHISEALRLMTPTERLEFLAVMKARVDRRRQEERSRANQAQGISDTQPRPAKNDRGLDRSQGHGPPAARTADSPPVHPASSGGYISAGTRTSSLARYSPGNALERAQAEREERTRKRRNDEGEDGADSGNATKLSDVLKNKKSRNEGEEER